MSGFLNSLVARNLGRASTIRPRLASLFEPTRGNAALFSEFSGQAMQGETTSMDETKLKAGGPQDSPEGESNFQPKRRHWTARKLTPMESDVSRALEVELPDSAHRDGPDSFSSLSRVLQWKSPTRSMATGEVEKRFLSTVSLKETDSNGLGTETVESQAKPAIRLRNDLLTEEHAMQQQSPGLQNPSQFETRVFSSVQSSSSLLEPAAGTERLLDRNDAHQNMPALLPSPVNDQHTFHAMLKLPLAADRRESKLLSTKAKAESEPSIQVTIGRIEIRAETAGAVAHKAERTASPVMGPPQSQRSHSRCKRSWEMVSGPIPI